jgi:hypothetical protein
MNEAVAAKLKQLADELWSVQHIGQLMLYRSYISWFKGDYPDFDYYLKVVDLIIADMNQSKVAIQELVACTDVRTHIQGLGSHACWCFARIDDLVTQYSLYVETEIRRRSRFEDFEPDQEIKPTTTNGWMEISQLSDWLSLLTGLGPRPTQQELTDAVNHDFDAVELKILEIVNDAGHLMTNPAIHAARETDSDSKTTKTTVVQLINKGFLYRPGGPKSRKGVALTKVGRVALRSSTKDSP